MLIGFAIALLLFPRYTSLLVANHSIPKLPKVYLPSVVLLELS